MPCKDCLSRAGIDFTCAPILNGAKIKAGAAGQDHNESGTPSGSCLISAPAKQIMQGSLELQCAPAIADKARQSEGSNHKPLIDFSRYPAM